MKAVVCSAFGDESQIQVQDIADPVPSPTGVVIRVQKASVSYMDWLMTQGRYQLRPDLPYVPGTDAVGHVVEVGSEVNRFKVGDRVACSTWFGAYAELMAVPADVCTLVPYNVSDAHAATVLYAYGTARYALVERARLEKDEYLFVTGAAGGVGIAALEVGRLLGARVIAGVGSDEKARTVREYGAEAVIVYTREDTRERINSITDRYGIDVCFETVGGALFDVMARAMAWNGRLMPIGFASGEIPSVRANLPLIKNYSIVGAAAGPWWERCRAEAQKANDEIFDWLSKGLIHPRIDREFPLDAAVEAMRFLATRRVQGRIVLNVGWSH